MRIRSSTGHDAAGGESKSVIVSEDGAALKVERISLSNKVKRSLTTSASSVGSLKNKTSTSKSDTVRGANNLRKR